eukprot:2469932-Rhodomonas_salina.1
MAFEYRRLARQPRAQRRGREVTAWPSSLAGRDLAAKWDVTPGRRIVRDVTREGGTRREEGGGRRQEGRRQEGRKAEAEAAAAAEEEAKEEAVWRLESVCARAADPVGSLLVDAGRAPSPPRQSVNAYVDAPHSPSSSHLILTYPNIIAPHISPRFPCIPRRHTARRAQRLLQLAGELSSRSI